MERFSTNGVAAVGTNVTLENLYENIASPYTRLRLYDLFIGCGAATADATMEFTVARTTGLGTPNATFTPNNLDSGGPGGQAGCGQGTYSGEPTYTASKGLIFLACHQRNTVRWVCPEGSELVIPATQNNGLGVRATGGTSTASYTNTCLHKE